MEKDIIRSFEIKGYKKFKQIKFDNLSKINLFLGNNNTGKTTILETVYGYISGTNLGDFLNVIGFRNRSRLTNTRAEQPFDYFYLEKILSIVNNQDEVPFQFSFSAGYREEIGKFTHVIYPGICFADIKPFLGEQVENQDSLLKGFESNDTVLVNGLWMISDIDNLTVNFTLPVRTASLMRKHGRFIDILSHRDQRENTTIFSFLKREGLLDEFIREMSKVFPDIESIDVIPYPDGSIPPVSIKLSGRAPLPLYNFGDGMQRWFNLLGGMIIYKNAVHCIEEIDATVHTSAYKELASNLVFYAKKYNSQLFMTSHSIEFVDNLLEAIYGEENEVQDTEDIIRIITLKDDKDTGETKSRVLTGREAYESREKYGLELR